MKKNIIILFILKGGNMLITFFMVPLLLLYLSQEKYGIWLTLTSIIGWFSLFDIGLGNGLRNRFAEAKAEGNIKLAGAFVSTTYFLMSGIAAFLILIFFVINPFLHWDSILNTSEMLSGELSSTALVIFIFFALRFVLDLISIILMSDQQPGKSAILGFVSNALSFVGIWLLSKTTSGSLLFSSAILSGIPVGVLCIGSIYFYTTTYRQYRPSVHAIDLGHSRSLVSLGLQFFVIQITALMLMTATNLIVTQLYGPEAVAPYNIAQRYIGIASMMFMLILTPFWSAYTEAYKKNEIEWIRATTKKVINMWLVISITIIGMVAVSPFVYGLWIGKSVQIPLVLTALIALFSILSMWNSVYANFINGVGKIRLQLYSAVSMGIIHIPLSLFLAKTMHLGINGVILSACCVTAVGSVWAPIQYKKIIDGTAKGIWDK